MSTKQEKLAAARKKLKEFQGKRRENGVTRMKCDDPVNITNTADLSVRQLIHHKAEGFVKANHKNSQYYSPQFENYDYGRNDEGNQATDSDRSFYIDSTDLTEVSNPFLSNFNHEKCITDSNAIIVESSSSMSDFQSSEFVSQSFTDDCHTELSNRYNDVNPHFDVSNKMQSMAKCPNTDISLTQVSEMITEKNNLLQILKKTEEFLKYKTEEAENMVQNISILNSKVKDLEENLLDSEYKNQQLRIEKSQLERKNYNDNLILDDMKKNLDLKNELLSELQTKLELKKDECMNLGLQLQKAESQLSSSAIKIQQLSVGEFPEANIKISSLQNENASLSHRIQELQKCLETINMEKEQSSQHFQTYAQQSNNELASLSAEVKFLIEENQLLLEKNGTLENNLRKIECEKKQSQLMENNSELTTLSNKLKELHEENETLQARLKLKGKEIDLLKKEIIEKSDEVEKLEVALSNMKSENLKLLEERKIENCNQKLLAAMESDKVAAARAVTQNQKLKDQITELEEGFIKMSHEKLQLADELSHEKHVNKTLELRLREFESSHSRESEKASDFTINESGDLCELKNIIRQLEKDKTALLSRLNSIGSLKNHQHLRDNEIENHYEPCKKIDVTSNGANDPEKTRIALQQMEEKVKKTMNEIATLDEEKEKLEHLVLQLQSETETIGEYISLYQTQRMLMRQKNKEKDDQLLQLFQDKEELRSKLETLNNLVRHLLAEKGTQSKEGSNEILSNISSEDSQNMAVQIQSLISEIQSTNLINGQSVAFQHCPCCSGRLITI